MRLFSKMVLLLFALIIGILVPRSLHAQTDTKFWVALPYLTQEHGWNMDGRHLVVSTLGSPATVTVSVPANASFKPIVVDIPANSTERIDMTSYAAEVLLKEFDTVTSKGVLIESTDNVTAYMEVMNPQNAEIYALKGRYAMGTDFYVPTQNKLDNYVGFKDTALSSIDIVATEDNTVITIVPTKPVMKKGAKTVYPANVPITITLPKKGQTYSLRAVNGAAASHLSGTHITSTQPIVVSYKDDSVVRGGWDLVGDQLIPVSVMGTQYIAVKGFLKMSAPEDEFVFAVIAESGTTLKVDGVAFGGPYAAGTTVAVPVKNKYTIIESNSKKFTCFHLTGTESELAGTILPPTDQCTGTTRAGFSYSYGSNTATSNEQKLYINIMVRKGAETGFLLDGKTTTLITAAGFTSVNTYWSVGQFGPFDYDDIAKGAHVLSNTKDQFHMGYINTSGPSTVYGYFSDFKPSTITAIAVKTKSDVAVQCVGDSTRLRVDGGIAYLWTMFDDTDPTTDVAADYLSETSTYNPYIVENTPIGKYTIKVRVWGPCGALPVDKVIKMEVKAAPKVNNITETLCESEYGSGCIDNYDLDKFLPKVYGETGLSVVRWRKEVKNSMFMLDDFENDRNLTYNINTASTFNTATANPLVGGINSSATVLMFKVSGNSGYFNFSPRGGVKLDMTQGTKFSMLIRNVSSATSTLRTVTMKLIGTSGDTVKITNTMSRFNAWEEMTFDFSTAPKKVYSEVQIEFGKLDWQTDVFYIDEIRKFIDLQVVRIENTDSAAFCTGGKLFVTVQNTDQCQVEATVTTSIGPGSFTVKNPTISICESEYGTNRYTGYDLTPLLSQIVTGSGYSIDTVTGWKYIAKNQNETIEDFELIMTTITAVNGTFTRGIPNPRKVVNTSTVVGSYRDISSAKSALSVSLPKKIALSDGYKFYVQMYDSAMASYALGAVTVDMELRGPGVTTLTRTGTIVGNFKWETLEFDFSSDNTKSGFDEIRLLVTIPGYQTDIILIDNVSRLRTDHEDFLPFSVKKATINDGDKFFAYVKDANGCLVKSTITFAVKPGTGTANATTATICQSVAGGPATGVDLTQYSNQIIGATGVSAGNKVIRWVKKNVNFQDTLSNFEKTSSITWTSPASLTVGATNPFSAAPNTSTKVLYVPAYGSSVAVSGALTSTIDLSKGSLFKIKVGYKMTATYGNGTTDTHSLLFELVGASKTVTMPVVSIHSANSDKVWKEYTFDLSAYATYKDFDQIRITFTSSAYQVTEYYIDDLVRVMQPFESDYTTPTAATVSNGDVFYAIVKEPSGCLARGSVTFTVKECDPPAIDQSVTLCEETRGLLKVTKQDLTKFDLAIRDSVTTNTVTWYSDKNLTSLVASPTSATASNGTVFYALVKSPKNKQDTATLTYMVLGLPNPKLPKDTAVCENAKVFTLTATPSGGTFKGIGVSSAGVYTPAPTIVGKNVITYTVTDANKCVDSNKVTVEVKALPKAKLESTAADLKYCGTTGGKVVITNITGATYSWTLDGKALTAGSTVSSALKGTYAVTVDLNGCTQAISDIVVIGNPIPTYTITGGGTFCNDTTVKPDITLTLTGTAPWSVAYNNGTKSITESITASPYKIPSLVDGTYKVESISDANCTGTATTQSVVYKTVQRPTSSVVTTDFDYCGATSDVKLEVSAFTGASYVWKLNSTTVGGNSNVLNNATAGTYSVTLTNDICKTTIGNITVVRNEKPTYSFSGGGSFCDGKKRTPVSLTLTGKANWSLTYDIDGAPKTVTVTASPYQIADTIAGTYSVKTLSDGNTCTADVRTATDATAQITILPKPTVNIAAIAAICSSTKTVDVSSSVSPKTGGVGTYYGDAINATSGLFTHSGAKTYRVGYSFKSTNGCVDSAHTTIVVNANPTAAITPRPAKVCIVTDLTLQANPTAQSGIDKQEWTGDVQILSDKSIASPIVNSSQAKKYALTYTVTDKNGCLGNDTITVTVNDTPSVAISVPTKVLCRDGGAITLTPVVKPTGGTGKFSPDSLMTGTSFDPKNHKVGANIIRYDYTDLNGCSNFDTVRLFTKTPPVISVSGDSVACIYESAYSLTAVPTGGSFTGSAAIDKSGLFTPATIGDASKKVTANIVYEYADNNGCTNKIAYPVTVYPRPAVAISGLTDTVCYPQAASKVTVSPVGGTLSGSGIDAVTYMFTPKTVGQNQSTSITYKYTDLHGCENSTSKSVFVRFTAPPTVPSLPYSIIKNEAIPAISATGTAIKWYDVDSAFLSLQNPYIPSFDNTKEGKYVYKATQTISGCESNTASVRVEVNNCPAKAPIPLSDTVCQGSAASYLLKATKQGTGRLDWFDASEKSLLQGSDSYTINQTSPATYSFVVKEFDLTNNCYGAASEVHLTIRALPTVSIVGDSKVCWPSTEVKYAVSPVGGEFTGVGIADKASNVFNPSSTPKQTATYTLTYKGFETVGSLTCSNTATKDVTVTYSAAPVITTVNPTKQLLADALAASPSFIATGVGTIEWYDNAQAVGALYSSASPSKFDTKLNTATGASGKPYWLRAVSDGCPSDTTRVTAIIMDCPTPKPTVVNIADCENADSIRVLRAVGDQLRWYNASNTLIGNGAVYAHGLKTAQATPYTFWVTQTQTEPVTGKACEGPKQEVSLTIYAKPNIQFVNWKSQACVDASVITISTKADKKIASEEYLIDLKASTNKFLPSDIHPGLHTVKYSIVDNDGCTASLSQTIQIDSTPAPTIAATDREISEITVRPVPSLKATGTMLQWYYLRSVKTATVVGTNSPFKDNSIGEDNEVNRWYYVTQTLNGCQSLPDSVWLRINHCPVDTADVTISKENICAYDPAPTFTARQGIHWTMDIKTDCVFKWYSKSDKSIQVGYNAQYSPSDDKTLGKRTYYVSEYNNYYQCEGPLREVVFNRQVVAQPAVKPVLDICQFMPNPAFEVESPVSTSQYAWYNNADTSDTEVFGTRFTSSKTDTAKTVAYVVQIDKNGCRSTAQSASFTIKPKPVAPTVLPEWVCVGDANKQLIALGRIGSTYSWNMGTGTISGQRYTPKVTTPKTYTFYVTQILNNCESEPAEAVYTIRYLPDAPIVAPVSICPLRTTIPTLVASNCTDSVTWKDASGKEVGVLPSFTPAKKATQTFTVERIDNGCKNKSTVQFKVYDQIAAPTLSLVQPTGTICFATPIPTVKLSATAQNLQYKLQWYQVDTTSTGIVGSWKVNFVPTNIKKAGTYYYYASATDLNGCQSEFSSALPVTIKEQAQIPSVVDTFLYSCSKDAQFRTMEAVSTDNVIWYDSKNQVVATTAKFVPKVSDLVENDTSYFYARATNGCPSEKSDSVGFALYRNPNKPVVSSKAICYGATNVQPLIAKALGTVTWHVDSLTSSITAQGDTFAFNPQAVRDYTIITQTVWNTCMSDTLQKTFTVAPIPTPRLVGNIRFCEGYANALNVPYRVFRSNTDDKVEFFVAGGTWKYQSNDDSTIILTSWSKAGFDTVYVTETSQYGCVGYDTLAVQVARHSTPSFKWTIPGSTGQVWFTNTTVEDTLHSARVDSVVHLKSIVWHWGHSSDEAPEVEPYSHYKKKTTYKIPYTYGRYTITLKVQNDHGCVDSVSEEIFFDIQTGLFVPNAFLPEHASAELNTFKPKGFNIESYEIVIYDMWGNILWSSTKLIDGQPAEGWDGRYKGELLKGDVYMWRIKAKFNNGRMWEGAGTGNEQYGNLILLR